MSDMEEMDRLQASFDRIVREFRYVHAGDIPDIDLYMDQVTTFMDQHLAPDTRDPAHDRILTKTMINNYAKNDLLLPPVKKKYGKDHMILLLLIFYLKSYLSIGDIEEILRPVREHYTQQGRELAREKARKDKRKPQPGGTADEPKTPAGKQSAPSEDASVPERRAGAAETGAEEEDGPDRELRHIYEEMCGKLEQQMDKIRQEAEADFLAAAGDFTEYPEEDRARLQRLDLILRMSAEIYVRKLFVERLLDEGREEREQ